MALPHPFFGFFVRAEPSYLPFTHRRGKRLAAEVFVMSKSTPSVETILAEAVEIAEPAQRQGFVEQACGGDGARHARLNSWSPTISRPAAFWNGPPRRWHPCGTVGWGMTESASGRARSSARTSCWSRSAKAAWGWSSSPSSTSRSAAAWRLKVIKPGMDTRQVIARFEAERQALALMDHPHIAKVLDGGTTDGRPALLRHGAGQGHADHRLLRPAPAHHPPAAGTVPRRLPGRAARASERASSTATSSRPTSW